MRCFIAIELPEQAIEELRRLQDELKKSNCLKASYTKEHHLTLKFLGEITPATAERTMEKLRKCTFTKFTIETGGIGFFPNESRIRVIWTGIKPEEEALKLQKQIDEALQKDFPKEKNFKPHITLARVKQITDKTKLQQMLKSIKTEKKRFETAKFKLKKSTLTKDGAKYEDLETYESD